jgi:hypothetical protein
MMMTKNRRKETPRTIRDQLGAIRNHVDQSTDSRHKSLAEVRPVLDVLHPVVLALPNDLIRSRGRGKREKAERRHDSHERTRPFPLGKLLEIPPRRGLNRAYSVVLAGSVDGKALRVDRPLASDNGNIIYEHRVVENVSGYI